MYKIMYRIINENNNDFCFVGHRDANDEYIIEEYATEALAKEAAKPIIKKIGANDVRIVLDKDYYLKVIMGGRPEPIVGTYEVQLSSSSDVTIDPDSFENIESGSNISATVTFTIANPQFHFVVDGEETAQGVLSWIEYEVLTNKTGKLTLKNITANHEIIIVVDGYTTA